MDAIPFEKVSIQEAKNELNNRNSKGSDVDWSKQRTTCATDTQELTAQAMEWVAQLPKEIQPHTLTSQFARIVNRLAELWTQTSQCEKFFDELLLDKRLGRAGFPVQVAHELFELEKYFKAHLPEEDKKIWPERWFEL